MAKSVITYATQRLIEVLVKKAKFLKGVRGEVEWLRDELQRMHVFLKDADSKQEKDPLVGKELEALRVRISNISKSCETYGIRRIEEGTSSTSIERLHQLRRSSPRGLDRDIIGMENDTTQLVANCSKWRIDSL
ncbi:hypothetical protein LWI29_000020 [Acer saccharum]|uniref:Disease resistance N-terminal domain-containing protein n=1 Tax=Acer saccharum TaxID=4024 RepID=A0AA39RBE7_ACESA|nr:hypothetical protein LWI29_000020 [Acer saccharum]